MQDNPALQPFLMITVALIMLSLGLGLTRDDFRRVLKQPRAAVVGLVGQLVFLPAAGYLVAVLFGLQPEMAVGMMVLAACPGGAHSNLFANLARADTALSVSLTAVSSLASIITIPLWIGLATSVFAQGGEVPALPVLPTMLRVFLVIAVPTVLGVWVRERGPGAAATMERWTKMAAVLLLLVIVVGSVARQSDNVLAFAALVGVPVAVLNLGTMAAGYVASRLTRLERPQAITIVLEIGVQNSAMAVGIAMGLMGSVTVAVPAIVYSLLVYFTGGAVVLWGRRT